MDGNPIRKSVAFNPKLADILQQLSQNTGIEGDALVNLAVYELARRLGFLTPQTRNVPAPAEAEMIDLLAKGEAAPAKRPRAPAPPGGGAGGGPPPPPAAPARRTPKATEPMMYVKLDGDPPIAINKDVFLIGRGSKCDCVIANRNVSREHAMITRDREGWVIEDLNSSNGTWINGNQIQKHRLQPSDRVQISTHNLTFTLR